MTSEAIAKRWVQIVEALVAAEIPPDATTVAALAAGVLAFKLPTPRGAIGFVPPLDTTKRPS